MDTNRKTLVVAALILVLSLVAFNLNIGDLSGRASSGASAIVSVSPNSVACSRYQPTALFTVTIEPRGNVDSQVTIRNANDGSREKTESLSAKDTISTKAIDSLSMSCGNAKCFYLEVEDRNGNVAGKSNTFCVSKSLT